MLLLLLLLGLLLLILLPSLRAGHKGLLLIHTGCSCCSFHVWGVWWRRRCVWGAWWGMAGEECVQGEQLLQGLLYAPRQSLPILDAWQECVAHTLQALQQVAAHVASLFPPAVLHQPEQPFPVLIPCLGIFSGQLQDVQVVLHTVQQCTLAMHL